MDVLIIGSGAREHAIAWKLRQSPGVGEIHVAPGNAGTGAVASAAPLSIPKPGAVKSEEERFVADAVRLARELRVDMVVVGPEDPLSFGVVDAMQRAGVRAFGPTRAAARIESSKSFAKDLMQRYSIPMGACARFDDFKSARRYVESHDRNVVVKADGLAAGKGAMVTSSRDEAVEALRELMLDRALGASGTTVVIEDRLSGRETSAHAFSDGRHVVHMPFACDHKPVFDGDQGPNTGGMGAYSPVRWLGSDAERAIQRDVTEKAVRAMADEGLPYGGVLFPNIIVTDDGPRVLEFNARFGDPEAEVLLPRLETDLLDVMLAVTDGTLEQLDVRWRDDAAVTVMLASGGYPGPYETGKVITGLDELDDDILVFHAGTRRDERGEIVTTGGRVLAVTAVAATVAEARERAYANVARIHFDGVHYRRDIGAREVAAAV